MSLIDKNIYKFTECTASSEPVPGGGSISALCGALSAALAQMVAGLTIGKKKYADVEPQMQALVEKLKPVWPKLTEAVDFDSEAYDQVFAAYKLPKETDAEKEARKAEIQKALKVAASVPMGVAQMTAEILPDIQALVEKGNQNAITDVFVAALCARTAILGACANVRINLMSITDDRFVDDTIKEVLRLEREAIDAETNVREAVMKQI